MSVVFRQKNTTMTTTNHENICNHKLTTLERYEVRLRDQLHEIHSIKMRDRPAETPLEEWVAMLRDRLAQKDASVRQQVERLAEEAIRRERDSGLPQESLPATEPELDELRIRLDREYNGAAVRAAQAIEGDPAIYKSLVDERDHLEARLKAVMIHCIVVVRCEHVKKIQREQQERNVH